VDKSYRRTKPICGQNLSTDKTYLQDKVYRRKTYRRTKPIGGKNLSGDKAYRRTKTIGGQNLSADKTYRRTKPIGGQSLQGLKNSIAAYTLELSSFSLREVSSSFWKLPKVSKSSGSFS
jgi:hypothetical protein